MGERVVIAELEIDSGEVVKEQQELGKSIEKLTEQVKLARKEGKQYSQENIKNEAQLKNLKKEYRANDRILQGLTAAQKGNAQTVAESRQAVSALAAEWAKSAKTFGEQDERTVKLQKELNRLNEGLKKQEGSWGNNTRNVGNYEDAIKKATEGAGALGDTFPGIAKGSNLVNKAFNVLKANPIILLISGLVLAIRGLIKIFSRNEESVDRYNKIIKQLGAVIAEVRARIGKFFQAFKNLLTLDFKQFGKDVKESFEGTADAIREAAAAAREIADIQVQIRKTNVEITDSQAERRKEIAKLILLTRDESVAFEQRRKALQEANRLEVENLNEQLDLQRQRVALAEKELEATPEFERTDEQRLKAAEERARLLDLETASITRQRELLNRINELENKANAKQAQIIAQEKAAQEESLRLKEEEVNKTLEGFELELQAFDAKLQAELELESQAADAEVQINNEKLLAKLEADQLDAENRRMLMEQNLIADFEVRQAILEEQRAAEIAAAKKVGGDVALINKKFALFEIQLEKQKQNAKLSLAAQAAGNIATIFGEESKIGKAAAIVQTTIDTFKSAQAAYSALAGITIVGPVLGALAAAAAVAVGIGNINKIKGTSTNISSTVSTPSVSTPSTGRARSLSSGRSASTGPGIGSLSASNLGASLSQPGSAIQAAQTEAIGAGVSQALQENPNILVLEEFQQVEGRQTEVLTESEL